MLKKRGINRRKRETFCRGSDSISKSHFIKEEVIYEGKKIGAILLASVMAVSMVPAMSVSAADEREYVLLQEQVQIPLRHGLQLK